VTSDEIRAKIRELIAGGALPSTPPVIQRSGQLSAAGRRPDVCAICADVDPTVSYFWPGGVLVKLHASCDALWKKERETR
jgi:hypothetical protein